MASFGKYGNAHFHAYEHVARSICSLSNFSFFGSCFFSSMSLFIYYYVRIVLNLTSDERERASMCAKGLVGVNSIVYKWMNECIFCFVVCTNSLVSNARICDCVPLVAIKFDFTHDNYIWTLRQTYNSSHLWEPLRDAVLSVLLFVNCHFASFSRLIAACFHFLLLKCLS